MGTRHPTDMLYQAIRLSILAPALLLAAKTYSVNGVVKGADGEKVPAADVVILDNAGKEVAKTATGKRFGGKGEFEVDDLEPGKYTASASKEEAGTGSSPFTIVDADVEVEIALGQQAVAALAGKAKKEVAPPPDDAKVLNELAFEVKKLSAELSHLGTQVRDLNAKSEMWSNPLSIYGKEIILENGSTVFGKVVYQDEEILKVETLLGYLVVNRDQVVRIIDNVQATEQAEYVPEQIRESYSPPPMPKLAQPKYTVAAPGERQGAETRTANVVLVGNVSEAKDRSGNIRFSGEVKNLGGRRADFVKVNFVFRKNWSGETNTLTTFAKGSYQSFDSGVTSDASILPGATASFELIVPNSFGPFIGYSYTIDWEEYE